VKYKIGGILFLVLLLLLLMLSGILTKHDELVRVQILPRMEDFLENSPSRLFTLARQNSTVMVSSKEGKNTYTGTAVARTGTGRAPPSLTVEPRLQGKYIAEFSLLLEPEPGRELRAYIRQLRSGEIKRVRLESRNGIKHYRIPFELKKKDSLELYLRNAAFGFVSDPVFYRERDGKNKNYVFIVAADTLRKDRVRAYNPDSDCSPYLESFSRDAVVFDRAFSTSSWTTPAFMSLFTGLFPNAHNVNYGNAPLSQEIPTLFESIQEIMVTYCLNGDHLVSGDFGFHRGFDVYAENYADGVNNYASQRLFAQARELVENDLSGSALFFLHTYQVHNPYNPEIELARRYYPEGFDLFRFDSLRFIKYGRELYKSVSEQERLRIEKVYDAACFTFDFRFGEFLRFLKERGLYDDSLIIFLSDHGEEFLDHGAWEHGHSLYNEQINIPLIVKFPRNQYAGTRVSEVVSIVDVLPTVLDVIKRGGKTHRQVDGISLLDVIRNKSASGRAVSAYLAPRALRNGIPARIAVIQGHDKYIFNQKMNDDDRSRFLIAPPDFSDELYDLSVDPYERNNIIKNRPQTAVKLLQLIRSLEFKQGERGFLEQLRERLKSLGYF
jgi:arylsulfatase A-like enzyme